MSAPLAELSMPRSSSANPAAPGAAGQSAAPTESVLALQGMYCAACAGVIEAALLAVPGVMRAEVNAASQRAGVAWLANRTDMATMTAAVDAAGYHATLAQHEAAHIVVEREARRALWRLFVAGFCMMQVMMLTAPIYLARPGDIEPDIEALLRWAAWVLSVPVLLFSCGPFFSGAWRAWRQRRIGMDVPVALGLVITFIAGTVVTFEPAGLLGHEAYLDSMTMFVTFLLAGRWLEARGRAACTRALDALLQRLPQQVERLLEGGTVETVAIASLKPGDRVRVAHGQAFPGDGSLDAGHTQVDEALLTGESRPVDKGRGDGVVGGTVNVGPPVVMRVACVGEGTRYQQIVDLVQRALTQRPAMLQSADRWAGPFVWCVLVLAMVAAAVWSQIDPARSIWVAVSVLIVTCPCALSLAAPAALLSAAAALARRGVLVQRLDALEALAWVDTACFDKTGTLTEDRLLLAQVHAPEGPDRVSLLAQAASLAALSHHPLSRALVRSLPAASQDAWSAVREVPGQGIEANDVQGRCWRLGAPAWVGATLRSSRPSVAFALMDAPWHEPVSFEFDEDLRADGIQAVQRLRSQGLAVHMLSGDGVASVQAVAERLGITQVLSHATPEGKLATLSALQAGGHRVLMVGDGANDGPVLARADVSFALSHGSALAQQRADFIVLGSRLAEVPATRELALRTMAVVRQNILWAAAYNAACVPLALSGHLPPWAAGAGMALSSLLVVLNALRLSR